MPPEYRDTKTLMRLLVCASVGIAMAGTTFICAYREARSALAFEDMHRAAFQSIIHIKAVLEDLHKENGRYPEKLADLNRALPDYLQPDTSGRILDPWKHPYEYRSDGQSYILRSLGIDGKPGGPGLAADLEASEVVLRDGGYEFPRHRFFRPTFRQYAFDLDTTAPVKVACILAGAFASIACYMTLRDWHRSPGGTLGRLLITMFACFVVTIFIAALHIPSHH